MQTVETESKKTFDERASEYFERLTVKPSDDGERQAACKHSGNDQTRTTESAFNDGWNECASRSKGAIETAYTTGAADQHSIEWHQKQQEERERRQRWNNGNGKKVFTYADLKKVLDAATPEQLEQQCRWWGEEQGGRIVSCEPLEEDYVNTGGDYMEPESAAREVWNEEAHGKGETFEDAVESRLVKGTLMMTDFTLDGE